MRLVVSAGGTREPIDPVRFITNRSSGKQGHAVAAAALRRGAEVVLVTTSSQPVPPGATVDRVETAAEMESAVLARAADADVVVMAAAVADFRPKVAIDTKLHKADGVPDLVLEATTDILGELGRRRRTWSGPGRVRRRDRRGGRTGRGQAGAKGVDLMVANDVSAPGVGFDHDTNAVTILGADGSSDRWPSARRMRSPTPYWIGCARCWHRNESVAGSGARLLRGVCARRTCLSPRAPRPRPEWNHP